MKGLIKTDHITLGFSQWTLTTLVFPDDGRSIFRNVASLNILAHDVKLIIS